MIGEGSLSLLNRNTSLIMKRKNLKILITIVLILSVCLFSIRGSAITNATWKATATTEVGRGIVSFGGNSSYEYQCPLIRKDGHIIAIALFRIDDTLVAFSIEYYRIAFLMTI